MGVQNLVPCLLLGHPLITTSSMVWPCGDPHVTIGCLGVYSELHIFWSRIDPHLGSVREEEEFLSQLRQDKRDWITHHVSRHFLTSNA